MAKIIVVSMLVCLAWAVLAEEAKYTNKFDNVNLEDILNSDRLLSNYVKCLKGVGKCTPDGTELKRILPDALETECAKCSEKQKEGANKVISHLINKKKELWDELKAQYDPTGKYTEKFQDKIKDLKP